MCLKFIDTEREKEINLGAAWPYEKLKAYECLLSDSFAGKGVSVGDKVQIKMLWTNFWNNMRWQYNEAASLNGWGEFPYYPGTDEWQDVGATIANTKFECTVADLLSKTYGKMPDSGSDF